MIFRNLESKLLTNSIIGKTRQNETNKHVGLNPKFRTEQEQKHYLNQSLKMSAKLENSYL